MESISDGSLKELLPAEGPFNGGFSHSDAIQKQRKTGPVLGIHGVCSSNMPSGQAWPWGHRQKGASALYTDSAALAAALGCGQLPPPLSWAPILKCHQNGDTRGKE